jgi:cation diffusion facilitator family transporter
MSIRPSSRTAGRALLAALAITLFMGALKIGVGTATSSLAILSQAMDSLLDAVSLGLAYLGLRIAAKPADAEHHYGHGKAENLVAFVQTLILGTVVIAVAVEAIRRLADSDASVTTPGYAFALLLVSMTFDIGRVGLLNRALKQSGSDVLRAGVLNFLTDVGTAAVAFISLLFVRGGVDNADAVGSLIVAAAVAAAAIRVGRRSVDVLMDRAPATPVHAIQAAAAHAPGVAEARRVRVRGSGNQLFADVTVAAGRTASLERAHDIAEAVEQEIERVAPGTDVVVHVEPISETTGLVERVQAAASRVDGVHEVHNVAVHAFQDAGRNRLHATLHAKIGPSTSLEAAHELSDAIEAAVEAELGGDVRVDTHIEPMEQTELGRDVTAEHHDLVESVRALAIQEPEVLDCHEVLVTESAGGLSVVAHVRGNRDLPLARMHEASQRIEKVVHTAHPDVGPVLIHFEPR